jgi:hypothetical protein
MTAPLLLAGLATVDLSGYRPGAVTAERRDDTLVVSWADESSRPWQAVFSLDPAGPLVRELGGIRSVTPLYAVTTGKRRVSWDAFFDHPGRRPEEMRTGSAAFRLSAARVRTAGNRLQVSFDELKLGLFTGSLVYTFYPGSRLVKQEAVVRTAEPDVAYFYDVGLRFAAERPTLSYYDTGGKLVRSTPDPGYASLAVRYRALATVGLAVFPAPHQYFFARDVTNNLGYLWRRVEPGFLELGIRQHADDGTRYYPWMNAPPGTDQRLALFLLLAPGDPLPDVLRYTHQDRYPRLSGYQTLATHWHFGYAVWAMKQGFDKVPFFKPVLKDMGVNIAMIMDFHGDGHPGDTGEIRLEEFDALFRACRTQSDSDFLIVPAEEANAHLGGHWALFFPRPVYWHQRRPEGRAFVTPDPRRGNIYATGSARDMLELVRRENGLMWQTHPRTKGSTGYPDLIRTTDWFLDPRWIGGGWKQMPSDLSSPRLGERSLRLLDDMNNWGLDKRLLAEVDVFKIDETHELWAHMNINYLRLPKLPSVDDWSPVADALRRGDYFVSTGEVLIPEHSIERQGASTRVRARLRWTFPLQLAEVVWGDGTYRRRHTIALEDTGSFGEHAYEWNIPAGDWTWMRLAAWDVAGNGGFTMPVRK